MPRFHLVPFPSQTVPPGFSIEGEVTRDGLFLDARYRITYPISQLVVPPTGTPPSRRDGLWQSTCAELFVAAKGLRDYVEVNLSPSGDWNAYRFHDYRAGMAPLDGEIRPLPIESPDDGELHVGLRLPLPGGLVLFDLDVAVTVVLEHASGAKSYWALEHTGPAPDFHRRDSFTLKLPRPL